MKKTLFDKKKAAAFLIGASLVIFALFFNAHQSAHFLFIEPGVEAIVQKILIYGFKFSVFSNPLDFKNSLTTSSPIIDLNLLICIPFSSVFVPVAILITSAVNNTPFLAVDNIPGLSDTSGCG
jgi:hypothetical protein